MSVKKRFLFTILPTNDLGLLTRSLPIARELSDRGHTVLFSHPAKAPGKIIAEAGFENLIPRHPLYELTFSGLSFRKFRKLISQPRFKEDYGNIFIFLAELIRSVPLKYARPATDIWDMDHAFAITGLLNANFIKAQCKAYLKVIEGSGADVVIDFWNPFACIACRIAGKPLITVNQADALPNGNGFIWWKQKPAGVPTVTPAINKTLHYFHLQQVKKIDALNVGGLTLVTGIPETDPLNGPHGFYYIGPVLWQDPHAKIPEWFDHLPNDRPIIWLYAGNPSYGGKSRVFDSETMLSACCSALADGPFHVVLSLGYHPLSNKLASLPANFQCVPYVPGLAMAARCDLMIHHGGYGSCQTGLISGTAALIIPTFSERESNARRIAQIGAGEYVLPRRDGANEKYFDPGEIRNKVDQLLGHPLYKENAVRYGEKLRSYGGVQKASDLIEKFSSI
ncbi:hypothetical protein Q4E93_31570 [Flavitalea sp. BT771]|uniref:glycosyltransferase n=1 Tax=Flavitalea sp. BT771 TaxID=3063329 RepID=UPI0026E2488E|nr:nucleotide disphospho-sugar-binding domain-containing protein [Flavitalea sp. BT771]MDO6435198.1 hypothetical protein [Flavitalea sp. BT771]MDV6224097.1 hypothetical protein [Flavitalea sp. BT771]